jgi:hypothetical protein
MGLLYREERILFDAIAYYVTPPLYKVETKDHDEDGADAVDFFRSGNLDTREWLDCARYDLRLTADTPTEDLEAFASAWSSIGAEGEGET